MDLGASGLERKSPRVRESERRRERALQDGGEKELAQLIPFPIQNQV
jgi:hypothetical protein